MNCREKWEIRTKPAGTNCRLTPTGITRNPAEFDITEFLHPARKKNPLDLVVFPFRSSFFIAIQIKNSKK